jgi:hypothetical protein
MILFLDFDGVTHPEPRGDSDPFCCLPEIEEVIRLYERRLEIVISSSWSELFSLDDMKMYFQPDVARLIVGNTRIIGRRHFLPGKRRQFERQWEVEQWLKENRPDANWLAIDDRDYWFEPHCPHLLLTNAKTGFTRRDADRLVLMIEARI